MKKSNKVFIASLMVVSIICCLFAIEIINDNRSNKSQDNFYGNELKKLKTVENEDVN